MMLNLNLVQMGLPGNQAYELLGGMEDLCKRAGGLIKQLLALSSQSFMRLQPLDLVGWLSRQSNALRSNLEQSITLQVCCKGAELCVNADENLMGQVLLELLRNAQEAMKSGGKIGLLVEGVEVSDQQAAEQEGVQPGKHVCLSVTDSGCGMEQSTMERMFEPFFSTKDVGKGAGLGLAAVRGIIHQHHGWIEAESAVGKGSAFRIYLPAIPVPVTVPSTVSPRAPAEGRRTILVVEDDPMVLKMTRRFLAQTSHTILEATHATEALAVWATECNNIDLLYTDMVMPGGMTGLQLAQKMMAEKPGMKVIITSGYNTDLPDLHRILGSSIVYLPKPCNPAMLLSVIQKCLH